MRQTIVHHAHLHISYQEIAVFKYALIPFMEVTNYVYHVLINALTVQAHHTAFHVYLDTHLILTKHV